MAKNNSNFNEEPHFPFTYGEKVKNDGDRLSDLIINKLKDKQVRNYIGAVAMAVLTLGSQAKPIRAIPIEYGEFATEAVKNVNPQIPEVPEGAKVLKPQAPPIKPVPVGNPSINLQNGQAAKKATAVKIPGPPQSAVGQYVNTAAIGISIVVICLNAAWGTPFMAAGCAGILIAMGNHIFK